MYPEQEWLDELDCIVETVEQEKLLPSEQYTQFLNFIAYLKSHSVLELQEQYVGLFDRIPSLSLHLFEHIHGDSRDRGQAMVDLVDLYRENGLSVRSNELPDYLPLFLEYLSLLSMDQAAEMLGDPINVIAAVFERLKLRENKYAYLFEIIGSFSAQKPDKKMISNALKKYSKVEEQPENIDKRWVEQPAFKPIKIKENTVGGAE